LKEPNLAARYELDRIRVAHEEMKTRFLRCQKCQIEEKLSGLHSLFVRKPINELDKCNCIKKHILEGNPDGKIWCCTKCGDEAVIAYYIYPDIPRRMD